MTYMWNIKGFIPKIQVMLSLCWFGYPIDDESCAAISTLPNKQWPGPGHIKSFKHSSNGRVLGITTLDPN